MKRIIKRKEAALMVGVSPDYINLLIETDGFPKPVTVVKTQGFIDIEVQAYIDRKIADRDAAVAGGAE